MKRFSSALLCAGVAMAIMTSAACAQTTAPNPAAVDRKAALAKECSKQADAKGLRGKPRKRFRDACKRGQTGDATKPQS